MKFSVPGRNIYDGDGDILYHGDIVLKCWGGGNDGKRYRLWRYHTLSISKTGKLKLSGCQNIVHPGDLLKTYPLNPLYQARGLDREFKEYY